MRSRLAWRRTVTAVGIYGAAVLGFLGTVIAARSLGPHGFGLLAIVLAAQGFFQLFLDFSVGDAVIKYGVRYVTAEDWGRLRRLLGLALRVQALGALTGGVAILALAPASDAVFGQSGLALPLAVSALIPLAAFPTGVSNAIMILRGRYEYHGLLTMITMAGRLIAMAVGSQISVTATVVGLLIAQVASGGLIGTIGWLGYRRFPRVERAEPLGADARPLRRFVVSSTIGTTLDSFRGVFPPLLLGMVTTPVQVAYFRAAQAPQLGFSVLSAPARIILLTEQTREVERGEYGRVSSTLRRYMVGSAALMLVVVPPAFWLMPTLVELVFGADYTGASDAARLILLAAAVQVVYGWTKPFPISIGRPNLRIVAQACEIAVLVPALLVLGVVWEATGAGGAVLAGAAASAFAWTVLVVRLRREWRARPAPKGVTS